MYQFLLLTLLLLATHLQAQDTIVVRDNYPLAIKEAKAGKKVILAIYKSQDLELPTIMDQALVDNLIGFLCDNCHLTQFPKGLENCSQLSMVEVNWFMFGEAPDNAPLLTQLFQVSSLKFLNIHAFSLPNVPFQGKKLEQLEWTKGNWTTVPAWVYQQTDLKVLRLGCNELQEIGEDLGNLTALQQFSLGGGACGGNPIQSLPQNLAKLTQLASFDLDYGQLKTFPSVLWKLPKLTHISLHYPGLAIIPDDIPKNSAVRSFSLSAGDEFQGFPPSFERLKLTRLRVDVNKPTCGAVQSQTTLGRMKDQIEKYQVDFRGPSFPDYMDDAHLTNQITGIWEAPQGISFSPTSSIAGQYLFLLGNSGYLANTITGMPTKEQYGKVVYDYERTHSLLSFYELQHAGNCIYGKIRSDRGSTAARKDAEKVIIFSFEYNAEKDILTLTNTAKETVHMKRVQ